MSLSKRFLAVPLILGILSLAGIAAAQTVVGVTATEIKIGNTNPYSGPASDRKSTRLNSSHIQKSRMPSSA